MTQERLVAYAPDGIQRFTLDGDDLVIGSGRDCDIRLRPHHVAPHHARLRRHQGRFEIEALSDKVTIQLNGRAVKRAAVESMDEIRMGDVTLILDDIDWASRAASNSESNAESEAGDNRRQPSMLGMVAEVSDWVVGDYSSNRSLESILISLLRRLGGGIVFLFMAADDKSDYAVKFVVSTEASWIGRGEELLRAVEVAEAETEEEGGANGTEIEFDEGLDDRSTSVYSTQIHALDRDYRILGAFPGLKRERRLRELPGLVHTLGNLIILGLIHHVGHFEPILPGKEAEQQLTLAPGLLLGESTASLRLLDRLRALIPEPGPILMLGETGCEFNLLARSLHLSSDRQDSPFVATSCLGADPRQLEVELFGAEIPGRKGPLRRQGRIEEAAGGTLLIEHINHLPLALQEKLVRFLRFGVLAARGAEELIEVDLRLMTTSTVPLERLIERGVLRVDLAYLLDRARLEVPPLRARREDLPLLIQWLTNRFCHQAGKRIQGITLKAMEALTEYPYPGNFLELENAVRELVYACPSGQPVHLQELPPSMRHPGDRRPGSGVTAVSDLRLDDLLAREEEAAIREALRRTDGNKSQAARLLGVSRNGLTMKMKRLGLQR
jgi:DNA-binding NtrC family response regulator/pSer/pThr/pTyr-binding forkhead associated (FHA) protein